MQDHGTAQAQQTLIDGVGFQHRCPQHKLHGFTHHCRQGRPGGASEGWEGWDPQQVGVHRSLVNSMGLKLRRETGMSSRTGQRGKDFTAMTG